MRLKERWAALSVGAKFLAIGVAVFALMAIMWKTQGG